jgi:hypothetical protein
MSLLLLKRIPQINQSQGVTTYLLIPDLGEKVLYGPMHTAILLANCWRLRRERPYVIACTSEGQYGESCDINDLDYVSNLPILSAAGPAQSGTLRNVEQGDLSPFVPRSEEGFLLFLPNPQVTEIPAWPFIVTELNSVLLSLCDEFIKIQTDDKGIMQLIEELPESDYTSHS